MRERSAIFPWRATRGREERHPRRSPMRSLAVLLAVALAAPAAAQQPWDVAKKTAGSAAAGQVEQEVNKRLLEEGRKNRCTFKTDSDACDKPCDAKLKNLVN